MTKAVALPRSGLTDLGHRHIRIPKIGIAGMVVAQDLDQRMAQFLADAQLPLAGPGCAPAFAGLGVEQTLLNSSNSRGGADQAIVRATSSTSKASITSPTSMLS
jgi:hypothetical protein